MLGRAAISKTNSANIETVQKIEHIEALCRARHNQLHHGHSAEGQRVRTLTITGASVEISGAPPDESIGRVYGFGIHEPATETGLDAVLGALAGAGASQIRFRVPPTDQRAEITEWLLQRGLRRSTFVVHWVAPTTPERTLDTSYEIRPLRPGESVRFGELIVLHYRLKAPGSAAFHARLQEIPNRDSFMAFDGETAIGTGATFREGSGCIVEYGTTLAPYRKQGLQRAMIGYRLNAAAAAGCQWACASTIGADRSSRNLVRQGFEKAYDAPVFTRR